MAKKSGKSRPKRQSARAAGGKTASTAKPATSRAKRKTLTATEPTATRSKRKSLTAAKPRRLKPPKYKTLRLQKRIKHPVKLPSAWRLSRSAALTLWQYRRLFIGITLIYALLNMIVAQGLANGTNVNDLKHQLSQVFTGHLGSLASSFSIFTVLLSSAGSTANPTAGAYQLFLGLIASLAMIWALRQALAGVGIRVRDAYYRGMYPLIPFLLVLMVVGLQLIPLLMGSFLYGLVTTNGIAVYFVEKLVWGLLFGLLALLSLYMITSSIFALYIVTLPDMTPIKALRSARKLVLYRRWTCLRKVLCLPMILLITAAIIMVPIIIWLTPLTQWVFFFLTTFALLAAHAYMYTLYRELLND